MLIDYDMPDLSDACREAKCRLFNFVEKESARSQSPAALTAPQIPASALESEDLVPLYEARRNIYPQAVRGTFRNIKWLILAVTLGIYYLLPFVRWDRGLLATQCG